MSTEYNRTFGFVRHRLSKLMGLLLLVLLCLASSLPHFGSIVVPSVAPLHAAAATFSVRLEAEDYRAGGERIGYHDTTRGNLGRTYRSDDVDIHTCRDGASCYGVGWI